MNKKRNMLAGFLLAALSPFSLQAYCQEADTGDGKDEWRLAVDVLKGRDDSMSKEWALQFLEGTLEEERDAFVLNVLGIAYLHGLGTEPDTVKAVSYLEASGAEGFKAAYHNLGMYYKYAPVGRQDFGKAYEAFCKGADAGSTDCLYDKGFMLYKGLGCDQDYAASVEEFRKAADRENPSALFMLGLCYRNGYGVEPDTARAGFYLRQSANLNFRDAMLELLKPEPEYNPSLHGLSISENMEIPDRMPEIEPYLPNNKRVLAGRYHGLLVTYDWSGEKVISEKPLTVDMGIDEDKAEGLWLMEGDSIPFAASLTDSGELCFDSTEVTMYDRYSDTYQARYSFEKADLSYVSDMISGKLRLYSLDEQEPERPMYVSLMKTREHGEGNAVDEEGNGRIYSYPNPYRERVTMWFELEEDVPAAEISLYTQNGMFRQGFRLGALKAGVHSFSVTPDVSENTYIVRMTAGNRVYQAIIFHER